MLAGFRALPKLDRDQYLAVRFEDLIADPATVLEPVARFLELPPDDGFVDRAAALVHGVPPARFPHLTPAEQEELAAACRPGQVLLGRNA